MLKVAPAPGNLFHNFKCAEIYFTSPENYDVTCCLCAIKMQLNQFPIHFQMLHLAFAEESNNLEVESMSIKEEDLTDYPIKQEEFIDEIDVDDKSWQQPSTIEQTKHKLDRVGGENLLIEANSKNGKILETLKTINTKSGVERNESMERKYPEEQNIGNEEASYSEEYHLIDTDYDYYSQEDKSSEINNKNDGVKDERPYPCHTCKRSFRSSHGLQTHTYLVHNPNKKPRKPTGSNTVEKCDECNKVFRYPSQLRTHKFIHAGQACDICDKVFTSQGHMKQHKIRHTGVKDFKCDVCGKCFYSKRNLKIHGVIHSSERPFNCDICGYASRTKCNLRVHKVVHTKDRKHVCKICGKRLARSDGLRCHMRMHNRIAKNDAEQQ